MLFLSLLSFRLHKHFLFSLPAFFPAKSTGEWAPSELGGAAPLLLSRSRTNPDLFAELVLAAQSPRAIRRRQQEMDRRPPPASSEPVPAYEGMRPRPRLVLGGRGPAPGQLNWPRGVCLLPATGGSGGADHFAVADSSNHRVQVFSAADGTLLNSFGTFGAGDGEFDGCCSVCVHKGRSELLVADRYNHRVQVFDFNGRFLRKFGCRGTDAGQFQHCWGIAVDEQLGLVYVVDKDNHRVQLFDAEGAFLTKFGSMGDGPRQFNHPLYIAFHAQNRLLYVSDSANNRICVFTPDGFPIRQIGGGQGSSPADGQQLKLPRGIALDQRGCLLVADSGNNRIQVFSPEGQCRRQFGTWGSAPGQFKGAEGLCLLGGDQLAIADRENNRVQLFSCSPNPS